jgi:hypothetical protein
VAGIAFAAALIGLAGFKAYSAKLGPVVQTHGTTYYNGESPFAPVPCKPGSIIRAAISQVHAKYDYLTGAALKAFEERAAALKGLPPLNIEELYVITEDDQLRNGEMVVFIGLRRDCVATVFGLPIKLYQELTGAVTPSRPGMDTSRS